MRSVEQEPGFHSSWDNLSHEFREAVILSNSLPEQFPTNSPNTSRRTADGLDRDRLGKLDSALARMNESERIEFQDYETRKHGYFVGYGKKFHSIMAYFKRAGMWGVRSRGGEAGSLNLQEWKKDIDWKAVPRQALVISETAGDIAEALKISGVNIDPEIVRVGGIAHSFTKRLQVDYRNSLKSRSDLDDYQKLRAGINEGMAEFEQILSEPEMRAHFIALAPGLQGESEYRNFIKTVQAIGMVGSQEQPGPMSGQDEISPADSERLKDSATRLLFYVHHIVKHSALVPLKERISDAVARYTTPESKQNKIYQEIMERGRISGIIEQEITSQLGIPQNEILEYLGKLFYQKLY